MKEHIDKGEYSVILGEDASGRLPALLFQQVLTTLYKEKNLPFKKIETLFFSGQNPETLFFAGQRIGDPAQREKIVKEFKNFIEMSGAKEKAENKKILVVTEVIETGKNLFPFTDTLRTMKINFDIATIGFLGGEFKPHSESIEYFLGGKIFWGIGDEPKLCHQNYSMGGVKKLNEPALFAKLFPASAKNLEYNSENYPQMISNEARRDIKILAQKLVKWYKEENSDVDK